jgi:hypothetical protein
MSSQSYKQTKWPLVRERTIPIERPSQSYTCNESHITANENSVEQEK